MWRHYSKCECYKIISYKNKLRGIVNEIMIFAEINFLQIETTKASQWVSVAKGEKDERFLFCFGQYGPGRRLKGTYTGIRRGETHPQCPHAGFQI